MGVVWNFKAPLDALDHVLWNFQSAFGCPGSCFDRHNCFLPVSFGSMMLPLLRPLLGFSVAAKVTPLCLFVCHGAKCHRLWAHPNDL